MNSLGGTPSYNSPSVLRYVGGHEAASRYHQGYGYVTRIDTYREDRHSITIRIRTTGVVRLSNVFQKRIQCEEGTAVGYREALNFTMSSFKRVTRR